MNDKKQKEEKVKKGLEMCCDLGDCSLCPYERARFPDELECTEELHADALALINRQKAEFQTAEAKVAREIFEEIEKTVNACVVDEGLFSQAYFEFRKFNERLAELKKKWEGEG